MMDPLFKEKVIGKCFAISGWAARRGRSNLNDNKKEFDRIDKILNTLIEQLTDLIKKGSIELINTKEEDVWNE